VKKLRKFVWLYRFFRCCGTGGRRLSVPQAVAKAARQTLFGHSVYLNRGW